MKPDKLANVLLLALLVCLAASGCRKRPGNVTNIPGRTEHQIADPQMEPAISSTNSVGPGVTEHPIIDPDVRKNWPRNHEIFKADTAHFDFDSSSVKAADKPKIADVADYLKKNPRDAVEVEGHCDERGTEEYNRSLGERRALALREELISLGIEASRIDTISYGKDKPAAEGHDEAAWRQNRRGEFALETPPNSTP